MKSSSGQLWKYIPPFNINILLNYSTKFISGYDIEQKSDSWKNKSINT